MTDDDTITADELNSAANTILKVAEKAGDLHLRPDHPSPGNFELLAERKCPFLLWAALSDPFCVS